MPSRSNTAAASALPADLTFEGLTVLVQPGRSARSVRLTVGRDGTLVFTAGSAVSRAELEQFLAAKREWILRKLAEKDALEYSLPLKRIVDGETFAYLGRSHQLRIVATERPGVRLHRGRLELPRQRTDTAVRAITEWYRRRGLSWLGGRVEGWAQALEVEPAGPIAIRDLGHRWGSAGPGDRVRFHWALMQMPPALVEYVLVHELAHLRVPSHEQGFWNLMGRVMPDWAARKGELARAGRAVWLGAVDGE